MTTEDMTNFIDKYLTDHPDCWLQDDTDTDLFPHPPTSQDWDLLIEDLTLSGHLLKHPNGRHILATKKAPTDFRKEILLHLHNSTSVMTDLRPLIKSLQMTRKEIIDTFSVLEYDGIVKSDTKWRDFTITRAGVSLTVDQVPFNFRLTQPGQQFVSDKYLKNATIHKTTTVTNIGNLHQGDNYGNYNQSSSSDNSINHITQTQNNATAKSPATFWKWAAAIIGVLASMATIYEVWLKDYFSLTDLFNLLTIDK